MLTARLSRLGLFLCLPLLAMDPSDWSAFKPANEKEAFFLRRIADFWQEGEYGIAKSQMEEFLSSYSESAYSDLIRICLGDLFLREKNDSKALGLYAAVSSRELAAKVFPNRMLALYRLEWYSTLADECEDYLKGATNPDTKLKATFYLAISLYRQCLNAAGNSELLLKLAQRAQPHFETLLHSELSSEAAQAFAHLSCILKDHRKAAELYLSLAAKVPELAEEMTFQAALIQAEFDRDLAIQSFEGIEKSGKSRAKEAAYNRLVLSFEMGKFEELLAGRDAVLEGIPEERKAMGRYYLGRSFLAQKKYCEAISELTVFLGDTPNVSAESIRSGLLCLIEAGHQSKDLEILDRAIAKLAEIDPANAEIPKGKLLRATLMKSRGNLEGARLELERLLAENGEFEEKAAAHFEWADLEYIANAWEACRSRCLAFLESYPDHSLAPHVWRYLASSSSCIANETRAMRERLAEDLEALLARKELFSESEAKTWQFNLAQSYFNLGRFEEAMETLRPLLNQDPPFALEGNAELLMGLCCRDFLGDLAAFCLHAENAIEKNSDLMDKGSLHIALFNAYLELSTQAPELTEKCAAHLYKGFLAGAEIAKANLLWLGERLYSKEEWAQAALVFSKTLETGFDETASYRLGKIDFLLGAIGRSVEEMERCRTRYREDPLADWKWEREAKLLLAEGYAGKGQTAEALDLLEEITDGVSAARSETIAKAYLQKALLSVGAEAATLLKDLVLQKRLESEPVHLEAALEYINRMADNAEKRCALLEKTKIDFEFAEDLLSKDYRQARSKYPEKGRLLDQYMKYIDEEILMAKSELATDAETQKELQAKAKDLLLQIKSESCHPALLKRVSSRLQNADALLSD